MQLEHYSDAILMPLNETFNIVPRVSDLLQQQKNPAFSYNMCIVYNKG